LKEKLDLLYERLSDADQAQRLYALSEIKKEVSGATSSMTSVPKPLKFLSKHYPGLKEVYNATPSSDYKVS
jgi:26S proteasome regulatory subunit N1